MGEATDRDTLLARVADLCQVTTDAIGLACALAGLKAFATRVATAAARGAMAEASHASEAVRFAAMGVVAAADAWVACPCETHRDLAATALQGLESSDRDDEAWVHCVYMAGQAAARHDTSLAPVLSARDALDFGERALGRTRLAASLKRELLPWLAATS